MRVVIETWNKTRLEWEVSLKVESDDQARYEVSGAFLRDGVNEYSTTDDLHVLGLVMLTLNALNSQEVIKRKLAERET